MLDLLYLPLSTPGWVVIIGTNLGPDLRVRSDIGVAGDGCVLFEVFSSSFKNPKAMFANKKQYHNIIYSRTTIEHQASLVGWDAFL